jgi:3-deoxy-manno-octulosonate cytidylyltransferase (CMP-KDO synthetase)
MAAEDAKMRIVAIIPARYGSSRFEAKPLALISGKPMIQMVYERTAASDAVDEVMVATDDRRIHEAVERFGGRAVMTSSVNRSGTDRVAEAGKLACLDAGDVVVNVQGDQPLMDARCIEQLLRPVCNDPGVVMSTLAYRIVDPSEITNPKDVKVTFDHLGDALYFSRSPIPHDRDGDTDTPVYKHLGFYAYTQRFLDVFRELPDGRLEQTEKLEQLRAIEYGYKIRVVVTSYDSPEVDLPEDIARVERLLGATPG